MKALKPQAWTLVIVGCGFIVSWMLRFTIAISAMEAAFFQQLIALAPVLNIPPDPHAAISTTVSAYPYQLQSLILLVTFSMMASYLLRLKAIEPSFVFIILTIFTLFMLQILFAIMLQFWWPAIWVIISFSITALLLKIRLKICLLSKIRPLSIEKRLQAIKQEVAEKNFETAVLMLKNCRFSDEMFDIAYDLGVELEQLENWVLARYLYVWLVQFDPGIEDFVTRMDNKINPSIEDDASTTEITQNRSQFGHYQLLGKKAKGSTATVYEAYDLLTHKRIALKILNSDIEGENGDSEVLSFLHEAMIISKLDHANIVKIHDADIINEQAYIAMDYITGYPMSERLRRKKYITISESLRIMHSVLNALIVAHKKGIVHGDIKPANIMYDQHRKLYILTDFGAANNEAQLHLSKKKVIIGTPAYMSPEQLSGTKMDGRSDIFSLAVTVYHLMAGAQPFNGETLPDMKKSVINKEVNLDLLSAPDTIKQILEKALQKKTYQRFADARQMLQAVAYCEQKEKGSLSNT